MPGTEKGRYEAIALPELLGRHGDGIESVTFGPRREMTLMISPLRWAGNKGYYGPAIAVCFGGIVNFDEVQTLFKQDIAKSLSSTKSSTIKTIPQSSAIYICS